MLKQPVYAVGRQQLHSTEALQASSTALHNDPGMLGNRLARLPVKRHTLGRQFDHIRQVDTIRTSSLQLKQDELA